MSESIGKSIGKTSAVNTTRKLLIMQKKSTADAIKTASKRVIQKTPEADDDF